MRGVGPRYDRFVGVPPAVDVIEETSFAELVERASADGWKLDDVFAESTPIDFSKHLLPNALTRIEEATFLDEHEALRLNQIMGKSYVNLFFFVEEYIVRDIQRLADGAKPATDRKAALAKFASEEIKHQALFRRFMDAFDAGFGSSVDVLDFAEHVGDIVLGNSQLAILLTTYHLEIITQEHYVSAVEPAADIEPNMVSILKHHWLDEERHTSIDLLEIKRVAASLPPGERRAAFDQYLGILTALFDLLAIQAYHDVEALQRAEDKEYAELAALKLQNLQHQGYSRLFLESGLRHPVFQGLIDAEFEGCRPRLTALANRLAEGRV